MINLIRGELLKIRTTNTWWLFGLGIIGFTALALLVNCLQANFFLNEPAPDTTGLDAEDAANQQAQFAAQSQVIAPGREHLHVRPVHGRAVHPAARDAADHERVLPPDRDGHVPRPRRTAPPSSRRS